MTLYINDYRYYVDHGDGKKTWETNWQSLIDGVASDSGVDLSYDVLVAIGYVNANPQEDVWGVIKRGDVYYEINADDCSSQGWNCELEEVDLDVLAARLDRGFGKYWFDNCGHRDEDGKFRSIVSGSLVAAYIRDRNWQSEVTLK